MVKNYIKGVLRMKKMMVLGLMAILMLTSCSDTKITKEAYDQVVKENEALKAQIQTMENLKAPVSAKIHGAFTASVKALIPLMPNEKSPSYAVLETFQGGHLFLMYIDQDKVDLLMTGETYRFEIEETVVNESAGITSEMLKSKDADLVMVCSKIGVPLKAIRKAQEEEMGLESVNVYWKKY